MSILNLLFPRARVQAVRVTLADGDCVQLGGASIELVKGELVIGIDRDTAVVARPDDLGRFTLNIYSGGGRIVTKIKADGTATPPLCRFGPGGDYTRDYTPTDAAAPASSPLEIALRMAEPGTYAPTAATAAPIGAADTAAVEGAPA